MSGCNEELLSAYFDGELPDDEKSLVEQLLEEDVAAREALDEVAEVSGWIRSLPRPAAPAELRDAVLARVRTGVTPLRALTPAKHPAWRRHARWAAASAAGLLLAVVVYQTWPVPDVTPRIASRSPAADADLLEGRSAGEGEGTDFFAFNDFGRTESVAADPMTVAVMNSGQMLADLEEAVQSGAAPVPGELVQNLTQVGDQVIVIQSQVVDTQDLLGRVQVLLTQNGIKAVNDSPVSESLRFDLNQNGAFEVIYVDAPTTNFNTAVDQITDLDLVTSVTTNTMSFTDPAARGEEASGPHEHEGYFREHRLSDRFSDLSVKAAPPATAESESGATLDAPATAAAPESIPAPEVPLTDQSSDGLPLGLQRERLSEMPAEPEVSGVENAVPAYQVPVQVSSELWTRLQRHEQVVGATLSANDESKAAVPVSKLQKQQRNYWNFAVPQEQGPPPPPDRVRAVILLVPQKSE